MNSVRSEGGDGEGPLGEGEATGPIVGGVGDEVLVVGGSMLALAMFFVAMVLLVRRDRGDGIHPEQAEPVESVRREMGVGEDLGRGAVGESAELEHCPICLSALVYPVDTNCGHRFCTECILTYWQHDQWPQAARCAVCRRPVSPPKLPSGVCSHSVLPTGDPPPPVPYPTHTRWGDTLETCV